MKLGIIQSLNNTRTPLTIVRLLKVNRQPELENQVPVEARGPKIPGPSEH